MADAQTISISDKKCRSLLSGLALSPWQPNIFQEDEEPVTDTILEKQLKESLENLSVSNKMSCSLCGSSFQSRLQQTDHYKLDWHRFNLKQSIMAKPSVSEEAFESMTGEISSISGSDEEDTDADTTSKQLTHSEQTLSNRGEYSGNRRLPKVFFKNHQGQLVAIYRCLLQAKKEGLLTQSELVSRATDLPSHLNWAILMTAAGHFAAAVFNGSEVVVHKTFHRYTVRAKRGTAQGVRDSQQGGHAPRSAGAALRRYNEAQLQENVQNLLKSWHEQLDNCSCIFIRAPSYNRSVIFSGKKALLKTDDLRIRTIPFPTRRPTLKEVKRVWGVLSSVDFFDDAEAAEGIFLSPPVSQREKVVMQDEPLNCRSAVKDEQKTVPASFAEDTDASKALKLEEKEDNLDKDAAGGQSDSSEESIDFILEEVESSTSHLQESEIFIPKQKRGRRKKKKAAPQAEIMLQDKQLRKIQTAMFTSCKTGDEDSFERKMVHLREKLLKDIEAEVMKAISQSEAGSSIGEIFKDKSDDTSVIKDARETCLTDRSKVMSSITPFPDKSQGDIKVDRTVTQNHPQIVGEFGCDLDKTDEIEKRVQSFLNEKLDSSGNLMLHIASVEGQSSLVWKLLSYGANPALKNGKHQPPFAVAKDRSTRQEFRRFMGVFPDKYDYKTAQVPAPLSAEEEAARADRAAEKRREQKKAKRKKQKEQKEEQKRSEEEERQKQAFVALSDREKRALAAEKRLTKQLGSTNRCYTCAISLDRKVPFHYSEFKFCSMDCLKTHKQQRQL